MDHSKSGDTEMNGGYDFNQLHLSLGCYIIYKSFCHFGHTFEKYLCLTKLKKIKSVVTSTTIILQS